ncbi:hypothetical protein KCM76_19795 [Zooshikella marina]|uniref:Uncharacterized protein n=1 Tax=Zooshikella ganghwensis TaxID=202772 RepID=A0A4P9VHZ2_9GAMM|nr:hypothetical protein [Zooshikella ganghwensis]MBU2708244.1 hypothetical protein [Zooshikella ganghwensis]RDH42059.1 hypothetical protein B9G39_00605 [Zooshikella ganghwensis]
MSGYDKGIYSRLRKNSILAWMLIIGISLLVFAIPLGILIGILYNFAASELTLAIWIGLKSTLFLIFVGIVICLIATASINSKR